jgi:hypothetical protein
MAFAEVCQVDNNQKLASVRGYFSLVTEEVCLMTVNKIESIDQ